MYQKISLNGNWKLQPGENLPGSFEYEIPVPAMIDNASPQFDWHNYDYFWYKSSFQIADATEYKQAFLQLEQVQFGSQIWLNGQHIGGNIPCYTSQWFALENHLQAGENIILVRVGRKHTLPEHSAVGNDQERLDWLPGIWGDVNLHLYGDARVNWLQILTDIDTNQLALNIEIENFSKQKKNYFLKYQISETKSGSILLESNQLELTLPADNILKQQIKHTVNDYKLWSDEHPFLYELNYELLDEQQQVCHKDAIRFGFRKFEIRDGHFYLNNKRKVLFGCNIAFHRLLNDSTRETLLWNPDWIKKAFIEIPKAHNFNFFRFHLGHAYNRWYDLADENGIMLEDEWGFWTSTGTPQQIEKEFKAWLRENCNRPSIMIWSALNESSDQIITSEIIPRLKELDPTRPWQHVDFAEDHPYIYSLGPVLNGEKFGFSRSIFDLEKSMTPTMVNEFEWWWLDRDNNPSELTKTVVERWLGPNWTKQDLIQHQAFLAAELAELWRRLDLDAIMPFVYLSVDKGPTANWFDGPLADLKTKPVLQAYKNAFAPIGVSLELWDRHFYTGEKRNINIYLFNDSTKSASVELLVNTKAHKILNKPIELAAGEHSIIEFEWDVEAMDSEILIAELRDSNNQLLASSQKQIFVFEKLKPENQAPSKNVTILGENDEVCTYLQNQKIAFSTDFMVSNPNQTVLVFADALNTLKQNTALRKQISDFVQKGGLLILQEPEFGIEFETHFNILDNLKIKLTKRADLDMAGYDSFVFPTDQKHKLWRKLHPEHFKFLNGALGGEIVSQHDVQANQDFKALARCGLSLVSPAVMEIEYGNGKVIISRIQVRGRLLKEIGQGPLYARRYDPVAEQYFLNLISL